MNRVLRIGSLFFLVISLLFFSSKPSPASTLTIKGNTVVSMYGFFDSETGWNTKSSPAFFKSNTSFQKVGIKGKTSSESRGQLRLGFKFKNIDAKTSGNITMDSWPNNFRLILSYVKQPIGKDMFIIIGKDWSLVNQRLFKFSSLVFKPYAAGFQGSKRNPQVQIGYRKDFGSYVLALSASGEYLNAKHGIVIGKNISPSGLIISDSAIVSQRKTIPAIAGQVRLQFKTGFGKPSQVIAYYELQPVYLGYGNGERKENSYLYSFASKINIFGFSLIGQYLHTAGLSGIAGIMGNSLKTYSYLYKNDEIIKRKSDALGFETVSPLIEKRFKVILGYVYLNFTNDRQSNDYFLKNEATRVKTTYIMSVVNITKVTKLIMEWDNIRTRYASDNKCDGNFNEASGNQFFVGYRWYF